MKPPELPILRTLRTYRRDDLRHDATAAAVLITLLVPAALGYAELSGLPAVTGLYATIAALAAYALIGPSPVLVIGPDSSLAPVIAATIAVAGAGDPHRAVALAGLLAILTGAVLVAGGLLRLGFVMDLFSKPIRLGYLNGVAVTVIVNQLPKLFGFSVPSDGMFDGAVAASLLAFVARAWRPHTAELVRVDFRKGYHDAERHPDGRRIPGLAIARFDAPLFFANAAFFTDFIRSLAERPEHRVRWIVVAADPITDVDTTAAEALVSLDDELARWGVTLVFAAMKGPVKDRLASYGLGGRFGPERFHPTLGTAVAAFLDATGTPWVDWTDRADRRRTDRHHQAR